MVVYFSYDTLMMFLMMLSVILLSMLMILLSTLSMIRHLICGHNLNWLLNLKLIYKTLWTVVGSGLLISLLEKLSGLCSTGLKTLLLLMQCSTLRVCGIHMYTWATGTYAWLIFCVRSHLSTFPFRLDYKTSKSDPS